MQRLITDDLDALLAALPPHISHPARQDADHNDLLEIIMDLGRQPAARYPGREVVLNDRDVLEEDLEYVVSRIGAFGDDNRAGIERTLHRISAIRNRKGRVVGLTCRIGRAVYGTIAIVEDLIRTGRSILLLGRPGVGKTTMLREVARVLADEMGKRVIIVDTSNEIAGDGDIPHPAIGRARRMQVATPNMQHAVMIEAVENHMPEVIVIDEIGTELEAAAARTIAERGVQLVGTAHGNTLENLMMNPTLSDLIGGIQSVTISDEEARRRGTQKSILERKAPPTFDIVVEIQNWERVAVHANVGETVDSILRGQPVSAEVRTIGEAGEMIRERPARAAAKAATAPTAEVPRPSRIAPTTAARVNKIYPFGLSRTRLEQAIKELGIPATIVGYLDQADLVMTLKNYFRKKPQIIREAEGRNIPIYVLKNNTILQMQQSLGTMYDIGVRDADPLENAMQETEEAIDQVMSKSQAVDLTPQNAYIRRLQHQMAERFNVSSRSYGKEPRRRVRIYKDED